MKSLGCLISFSSSPQNCQSTSAYQHWCVCTKLALRANRRHPPALCPQPQRWLDPKCVSLWFPKEAKLVRCELAGCDSPTPFRGWGGLLHTIIMLETTAQEVQELPVTRTVAKEEGVQKIFRQGLVSWSSLAWKFFGSRYGWGELQALLCTLTMSNFQQPSFHPTQKLLTRCHLLPVCSALCRLFLCT